LPPLRIGGVFFRVFGEAAMNVPPLRVVLLQMAAEHATEAERLERAEVASWAPPETRLRLAEEHRRLSEDARVFAEGLFFRLDDHAK
jgi:hypothetical protein